MSRDIAILWEGLPWYAARAIGKLPEALRARLQVLATRPEVPMGGIERLLGLPVTWLERERRFTWGGLGLEQPRLTVQTGWRNPCFNSLSDEQRRAGGRVVGMVDNSLKRSLRQSLGRVLYHLRIKRRYDAWWVPGRSGQALFRYFGEGRRPVHTGMYSADTGLFNLEGVPGQRSRELLYVGQFIERKNLRRLLAAFKESGLACDGWTLRLVGEGPLRGELEGHAAVFVEGFQDSQVVAQRMRAASAFILPSLEEHWGVVLCEAALCGCHLLASAECGAALDLMDEGAPGCFSACDQEGLTRALRHLRGMSAAELRASGREAAQRAAAFGDEAWVGHFMDIVRQQLEEGSR